MTLGSAIYDGVQRHGPRGWPAHPGGDNMTTMYRRGPFEAPGDGMLLMLDHETDEALASRIRAAIDAAGVDSGQARSVELRDDGATVEVFDLDEHGHKFMADPDDGRLATRFVEIELGCRRCGHPTSEHDGMGDCHHPDGRTMTGLCQCGERGES